MNRTPITKEEFDRLELILAKYQIPFAVSYDDHNGSTDRHIDIGGIVVNGFRYDDAEIIVKPDEKVDWNISEEETI